MSARKRDEKGGLPRAQGSERDLFDMFLRMAMSLLVNYLSNKIKERQALKRVERKAEKAGQKRKAAAPPEPEAPAARGHKARKHARQEEKRVKKIEARKRRRKVGAILLVAFAAAVVVYSKVTKR